MTADVQAKVEKLKMPQDIGRPGRFAGTRELSITRWHKVVIYRLNEDRVEIVTVLDTRMDPPDAL